MKILCLHGMGTNADIFKAQTASFRPLLPPHFEFDFLEGENDCAAAPGIAEIYREPYICWYPFPPTLDRVADAHEMIQEIIEEEGPFDGVMGFSQGAALAASILLQHEIRTPLEPPPFRFAVFICGSLPFSTSDEHGFDLSSILTRHNDPLPANVEEWKRLVNETTPSDASNFTLSRPIDRPLPASYELADTPGSVASFVTSDDNSDIDSDWNSPETPATPQSVLEDDTVKGGIAIDALEKRMQKLALSTRPIDAVHRFHPALDTARISVPTAHIYGKQDPYFEQSLQLIELCKKDLTNVFDHGGAHDIPRSENVSQAIASLVERTVTKSVVIMQCT